MESALTSLTPIGHINQNLSGFNCYSSDRTRAIAVHHYGSILPAAEGRGKLRQAIIYDSNKKDAKLIGIEYIIDEQTFLTLDVEEKKYWHSLKYEVESGLLSATFLQIVPESIANATEHATMKELHTSYGKTFHLWQVHRGDKLPMGPPQLMMSFVQDGELDSSAIAARDETENIKTAHKRDARAKYLVADYKPIKGCDSWILDNKGVELVPTLVPVRLGVASVNVDFDEATK